MKAVAIMLAAAVAIAPGQSVAAGPNIQFDRSLSDEVAKLHAMLATEQGSPFSEDDFYLAYHEVKASLDFLLHLHLSCANATTFKAAAFRTTSYIEFVFIQEDEVADCPRSLGLRIQGPKRQRTILIFPDGE
jgi:hypothetical protein